MIFTHVNTYRVLHLGQPQQQAAEVRAAEVAQLLGVEAQPGLGFCCMFFLWGGGSVFGCVCGWTG